MRKLIIPLLFLFPVISSAQTCVAVASGSINVPSLVDLDVAFTATGFHLSFDEWQELSNGKFYNDAIRVYVKSNTPWVVKVTSGSAFQTSIDGQHQVPSNLISIKSPYTDYMPLQTFPQMILSSALAGSNSIENTFYLSLKMISDWNSVGGGYNLNLNFSLSAP